MLIFCVKIFSDFSSCVLVVLAQLLVLRVGEDLVFGQVGVLGAGIGDDIGGEMQHLLQNAGADVQQQAHAGGDALEIPDVRNGRGQLDVAHALPAHFPALGIFH